MKSIRLACLIGTMAACLVPAVAQTQPGGKELRAITQDGRKVLLGADGRWRFDTGAAPLAPQAPGGESSYQTILDSVSLVFDNKKWAMAPASPDDPNGRRNFQHRTLPLYAAIIAEEFPASLQGVRWAILAYARKNAGMEPTVLAEETKQVQQREVGNIKFYLAKEGIEVVFSTRYHADQKGTVQVSCWTAQSLFHKYQEECEKLLDGLTFR